MMVRLYLRIPYCDTKKKKELNSNEYQLNYAERFTREKDTHFCYPYEELFKFPKQ